MSSTNEQPASQVSGDQISDTSSVCPASPNPSSSDKQLPQPSVLTSELLQPSPILQLQQLHQHQHQYQDSFNYPATNVAHAASAAVASSSNYAYDYRTRPSSSQQQPMSLVQTPRRNIYTGVDKLLVAAMLEETTARPSALANTNRHGIPTGRGIGYFDRTALGSAYSQVPTPSNRCEWELYNLLDKANLLNYFGTFLSFGGDDVHQLIDADEEEFLEIMSLVGMTKKPLHVRRLQKVLVEFAERKERQKEESFSMCRRAL